MTESERDLGKRWFEQVWNQGKREAITEMLAPDAVIHDGPVVTRGPEGFLAFFDRIKAAFSEIHINVEDTFAEHDKLCVRWSFTAKHTGSGLGVAPTGKTVSVTGMVIAKVAGNQLIEAWQNWDMLGMMEQIQGAPKSVTYIGAG